jgi:hypothetical protein
MTRVRHPHAFVWLLLAAALFMRAFLPQGYMPVRSDDGAITVTVCGAGHVLRIPTGRGEAPQRNERAEPPCAFAGLGSPALPAPARAELVAPEPVKPAIAVAPEAAPGPAAALFRPPVRGPPLAA